MDIYLSEVSNSKSKFTFPALPEKIKRKIGTKYQSYDIIGKGTVKIPKGMDVENISWSGVFFGKSKKNEPICRTWTKPATCVSMLRKWMENGTVLRLLVSDTSINCDVTISEFQPSEVGAFGNIEYSITFVVNKELKIYTTSELKIAQFAKKTTPRPSTKKSTSTKQSSKTYTVKSGDTLWAIARKNYGNGAQYTKIYNANKSVIESTAKKHGYKSSDNGHWIFPGTVLKIP